MKNVLIIGAGAQGNVITNVLNDADDVGKIVVADLRTERAEEIAEYAGSEQIKPVQLDASDKEDIVKLMKTEDFSLVVNATIPVFNRNIVQAACEAGLDYLDMASYEFFPQKGVLLDQLEYEKEWNAAGLTAVLNGGGDAGLVNVMAKEAADELDEIIYIGIKDFGVIECDEPVALWSMQTFMEDCYDQPVVWKDGKHTFVDSFSGEEEYYFPPPVDMKGKVYNHIHEEPMTIPLYVGKPVKNCDFKIGAPDIDTWKFILKDLDLYNPEKEDFGGNKVSPRELLAKKAPTTPAIKKMITLVKEKRIYSQLILVVDVYGRKNGERMHYKLWSDSPHAEKACNWIPGTNDVSWITSVPASIFSLMMLRGQLKNKGMVMPEMLDREERGIFFSGLKKWDITINKQVNKEL